MNRFSDEIILSFLLLGILCQNLFFVGVCFKIRFALDIDMEIGNY